MQATEPHRTTLDSEPLRKITNNPESKWNGSAQSGAKLELLEPDRVLIQNSRSGLRSAAFGAKRRTENSDRGGLSIQGHFESATLLLYTGARDIVQSTCAFLHREQRSKIILRVCVKSGLY